LHACKRMRTYVRLPAARALTPLRRGYRSSD
jgi:hypothetical protein